MSELDDDFMVARAHERIVAQQQGFTVVGVAASGSDALAQIVNKSPHLVLLDMYLPDMTGLDVIRRARQAGRDVDSLVLSAAREAEMVTAAQQGGAAAALAGREPDLAASECAELLGLSRVVARKYLDYLVTTGQAAVSLRSGQTGRPQRRYAWMAG